MTSKSNAFHGTTMSDTEQTLTDIWKEILNTDGLDPDENFFDCGGNSIGVMRMIARAKDLLNVDLPIALFMGEATIRSLAHYIDTQHDSSLKTAAWTNSSEYDEGVL